MTYRFQAREAEKIERETGRTVRVAEVEADTLNEACNYLCCCDPMFLIYEGHRFVGGFNTDDFYLVDTVPSGAWRNERV